jgi:threonine/homoserine/homoserine lactone efflux protein
MQQFLIVAAAHFLALLSPGPDFFLIARTSLAAGWRVASGACLGIAVANGAFIVAAFAGTAALRPGSTSFMALQIMGSAYLLYLGVLFVRHAGAHTLNPVRGRASHPVATGRLAAAWRRAACTGFLSGILNPKNALFYASLAAMLSGPHASAGWKTFYGAWMFAVVLGWDVAVAILIGNRTVLHRFARALPLLERISGMALILLALGVVAVLLEAVSYRS